MANPGPPSRLRLVFAVLSAAALASLLYLPGRQHPFESDDFYYLHYNPAVFQLGLRQAFFTGLVQTRPLTQLSHALNYHFHRLEVEGYHLVNLTLHALNTGLLVFLAALIYRRLAPALPLRAAFLAGALAAVHPVMLESVSLIGPRDNLQSSFFMLTSLLLYLRGQGVSVRRDFPRPSPRRRFLLEAAAIGSGFLAVLSKESAAVLPALVVLADYYLVDRPEPALRARAAVFGRYLVLVFGLEILLLKIVAYTHPMIIGYRVIPLLHFVATQLWVVPAYLFLLAFPLHLRLEPMVAFQTSFLAWRPLLGATALLALAAFALLRGRKKSLWALGLLWFFIAISVTSSIIPFVEYMSVRYLYFPALGLCLAAGAWLARPSGPRQTWAGWVPAGVILVCLGALSAHRLQVFKDSVSLYRDEIRKSPLLARPYEMMANRLLADGRPAEALPFAYRALSAPGQQFIRHRVRRLFEQAYDSYDPFAGGPYTEENLLAVRREHPRAFLPLARAYWARGDLRTAQKYYRASLASRRRNNPAAYLGLSALMEQTGDLEEAVDWLRLGWEECPEVDPRLRDLLRSRLGELEPRAPIPAISSQPAWPEPVMKQLNEVWRLTAKGDYSSAQSLLAELEPEMPDSPLPRYLRAVLREKTGEPGAAILELRRAVNLNPPYPPAFKDLARLLMDQGDAGEAETILRQALARGVRDPFLYFNLGSLQAQAGRFSEALALYQAGLEISPDHPLLRAGAETIQGYLADFY